MEITQRTETIIKISSIIILIILNLAIYYNGKDLSCEQCQVNFVFENQIGMEEKIVNVSNLYQDYKEGYCYVRFSENGIVVRNEFGIE